MMKYFIVIVYLLLGFTWVNLIHIKTVNAQACTNIQTDPSSLNVANFHIKENFNNNGSNLRYYYVTIQLEGYNAADDYSIHTTGQQLNETEHQAQTIDQLNYCAADFCVTNGFYIDNQNKLTIKIGEVFTSNSVTSNEFTNGIKTITIRRNGQPLCATLQYSIEQAPSETDPIPDNPAGANCSVSFFPPLQSQITTNTTLYARIRSPNRDFLNKFIEPSNFFEARGYFQLQNTVTRENIIDDEWANTIAHYRIREHPATNDIYIERNLGRLGEGTYRINLLGLYPFRPILCSSPSLTVGEEPNPLSPDTDTQAALRQICDNLPGDIANIDTEKGSCAACIGGERYDGIPGAYTAIGCLPTDIGTFLNEYLFTVGLGIAGGIAFILMLWGGFSIITSQGDPHKIEHGREIIISAGVGLLFIIFSVVILEIIGSDILNIPLFGSNS